MSISSSCDWWEVHHYSPGVETPSADLRACIKGYLPCPQEVPVKSSKPMLQNMATPTCSSAATQPVGENQGTVGWPLHKCREWLQQNDREDHDPVMERREWRMAFHRHFEGLMDIVVDKERFYDYQVRENESHACSLYHQPPSVKACLSWSLSGLQWQKIHRALHMASVWAESQSWWLWGIEWRALGLINSNHPDVSM